MIKQQLHHIQVFLHHLHLRAVLRNFLLISSLITLVFCRDISGFTSNYNSELWFYHFTIIERISMLLLLLSILKGVKKISWVIGELLLFFLLQDFIDRVFFNIKEMNINDYIAITIIVLIAGIKLIRKYDKSRGVDQQIQNTFR